MRTANLTKGLALTMCLALSCGEPSGITAEPLLITLTQDSSQIRIAGLPHDAVLELTSEGDSSVFASLFPVYKEAADPELTGLEPPYPGTYTLVQDTLFFQPDSGFTKGHSYRLEPGVPGYTSAAETAVKGKLPGDRRFFIHFHF